MARVERADVVIVGAGLLGLATAYALRGRRDVLLVERASIGHERGGSHGPSRVFRLGYPDPIYVRLAQRAQAGWRELEAAAGTSLLTTTGQLSFGPGAGDVLGALTAAGAPVEQLDADGVADRFPMFAGHGPAVFEPESGVLAADAVLRALRTTAACEVREHLRVRRVDDHEHGVRLETSSGVIEARVAVVAAGPWTRELVDATPTFATLEHVAYVHPRREAVALPVFIDHHDPAVYGLPTPGTDAYKIALHHAGAVVDPDATDLAPDPRAVEALIAATRAWLPDFEPESVAVDTCLYDNTTDEDFILDRTGHVVVGAGTSGHGFKFGVVLGELLAGLVLGVAPPVDLARFRADRAPAPARQESS
jgi:sarcosine oxidase